MAKDKSKSKGVPNKHLHARIAYLQQAASYLTTRPGLEPCSNDNDARDLSHPRSKTGSAGNNAQPRGENAGVDSDRSNADRRVASTFIEPPSGGLPLLLSSHLTQVARKSQIRLHPETKHQICKRCGNVLAEGTTSFQYVENASKSGKRPRADVRVIRCMACGATKRWPTGATRQKKKSHRQSEKQEASGEISNFVTQDR